MVWKILYFKISDSKYPVFRSKSKIFDRSTTYFDWKTRFLIWNTRSFENVRQSYSIDILCYMTELIILSKKDKNKKKLVWDEFAKEVDYPDVKYFFLRKVTQNISTCVWILFVSTSFSVQEEVYKTMNLKFSRKVRNIWEQT